MNFRYSPSMLTLVKSCPFRFYCKVTHQEKDDDTDQSYGNGGTVVHQVIQYYFESDLDDIDLELALVELRNVFNELWEAFDIQNPKMNKEEYWLCVINGIKLDFTYTNFEHDFIGVLKFPEFEVEYKGIGDVVDFENDIIGDWKTSTYKASKVVGYKQQLKFYAWSYRKETGRTPKECWVYFNKTSKPPFRFYFTDAELDAVEKDIYETHKELLEKFKTLKFERRPSRTNCYFCPHKKVCSTDLLRKSVSEKYEVTFHLKKDRLMVEGSIPDIIHRKIEQLCNYQVKNAHFIMQAMKQKGINYDGIKRIYRRREYGGETAQGYMHGIHTILKDYAHSQGKVLRLTIKDYRNQEVMSSEIEVPPKLNIDFDLYKYQKDAVDALLKFRWGIVEIGTGGGKTAIAAEAIRRVKTKTLFVIDNKALLTQTKREYEDMLGIKCGIVGMGIEDWSKPITLATIQTLAKHLKKFASQLSRFNCVIFDEVHIVAAKSFEKLSKQLINTKYRFGFSATAKRDDGNDSLIFAHSGQKVFIKRANSLIEENVLVAPTCIFYKYGENISPSLDWQNEYNISIVENETRNAAIESLAKKYVSEGLQVMILTKLVEHGKALAERLPGSKFIFGKTKDTVREEQLLDFKANELNIIVGNIKIFNKGLNIKNLDVLINATGNAGDVLTVQSIGRALRKNPGKEKALYIDFLDKGHYCKKHSLSRIDALKNEDYYVQIKDFKQS